MTFLTVNRSATAPFVLEQSFPRELEIDEVIDKHVGTLYRVWLGRRHIGSLYQDSDSRWIAQPVSGVVDGSFSTDTQAILIILFVTGNLAANVI